MGDMKHNQAPSRGSRKQRQREQGRSSSNKIRDIVRLQQLLKKWKWLALSPKAGKSSSNHGVPKGFFAVCVGMEMKRFVIPTEYLGHWAFEELLKEAEEEFGFQHEGALRIPCDVKVFEGILRLVGRKEAVCYCYSQPGILCR
ncbi:auxin-induced protein X15-like isoform X5 [Miscanthus floridulus]|uniref:auxin-induced protein X15-like isoform X5 n=1 Tax=Miscanthus floridulus TaxID=154761 RepID=UPI003459FE69